MASTRIQLRMLGYVATIAMHASVMILLGGKESKDVRILAFRGNRPRYLTGWNIFLQMAHAVLGLWCDYLVIKNATEPPKLLQRVREKLFTNIVFPGSFVVATLFWTLFLYDRELVFPLFLDDIIPLSFNHIIHTAIVPVVLYESLLRPRYAPRSHAWNCGHIALHCSLYASVLFYTYYEKGQWLYPILGLLSPPMFVLFGLVVVGLAYLFYFMQWRLTQMLWGRRPSKEAAGAKKTS